METAVDFLWYMFKFIGIATLIIIVCSIMINVLVDTIHRNSEKMREVAITKAIRKALDLGNYNIQVEDRRKKNKKD